MGNDILEYTAINYNNKTVAEKEFDILMFYYKVNKFCFRKYDDGRSANEKHSFIDAGHMTQCFKKFAVAHVLSQLLYVRDEYNQLDTVILNYFSEDFKLNPDEFVQKSRALLESGYLHNEKSKPEDTRLLLTITAKGEEYIEESIKHNITKIKREQQITPLSFTTIMKQETHQNSSNKSTTTNGIGNKVSTHKKTTYNFVIIVVVALTLILGLIYFL